MKKLLEQLKVIASITKYSMKMYFRDRSAIFFSLFVPILIMSIFGVLDFGSGANIRLGIVDKSKSETSKMVIEAVKKVEVFSITEGEESVERTQLEESNREMILIIPEGIGANLSAPKATISGQNLVGGQKIELLYDNSQNNQSIQIGQTILEKIFDQITHQISNTPNLFALELKGVSTVHLDYVDFLIPGIVGMSIMNMGIMGVIGAITSWRERGILKRLLATPIRPSTIIFGQVSTRLIISIGQVVALVGLGLLVFDLTIVGSIFNVFILAMLGSIIFLSMGLAASGIAKTQNSVMAIGQLISMPQMFLSGVFFPMESLPVWLSNITQYLPLAFLADGLREVMNHGASLSDIRGDVFGLTVWGVACFLIAAKFFSWE